MNIENNINRLGLFFLKINIKYFLSTIILVQLILHLPIFKLPPMGQHVHRQIMGLSMAKNYYDEDLSFFESAQDIRIGQDDRGLIYTEFPLLYWLIGKSYHITQFSHINGRVASFIFAALLLIGSYKLLILLNYDEIFCRWFLFFLSFTPFYFYYSISFLPNLPSLAMFILGIVIIFSQLDKKINFFFVMGVFLLTIATASKQLYLFYGLVLLYIFLIKYKYYHDLKILFYGFISGTFILGINYILYLHGVELNTNASIERSATVQLEVIRAEMGFLKIIKILQVALTTWFLEMYVNTAAIPIFFYGLYLTFKNKKWRSTFSGFWIMWILSFFIMFITFLDKFEDHGYYFTSISILAALCSTYGMIHLLKKKYTRNTALILVFLMPLVMIGRVSHRWIDNKQVPDELLYSSHLFQKIIPKNDKIIVLGDNTPVVFLYYMNRKGISYHARHSNILSEKKLDELKRKGIKWLVSDSVPSKYGTFSKNYFNKPSKIGSFHIIKL